MFSFQLKLQILSLNGLASSVATHPHTYIDTAKRIGDLFYSRDIMKKYAVPNSTVNQTIEAKATIATPTVRTTTTVLQIKQPQ